jgi:tetratricopeptide repeat protein
LEEFDPVRESARLIGLGNFSRALRVCSSALLAGRLDFALYLNLGVAYKGLGDLPNALAVFRKALDYTSDSAEAYYNLGSVLVKLGKFEEALSAYYKALAIRQDWPEAYSAIGAALAQQDRLEEALVFHRRARSLKDSWYISFTLGAVLQRLGMDAQALEAYDEAVDQCPDAWYTRVNRALLFLKKGDFETGWAEYEWRFRRGGLPIPSPARPQPLWDGGRFQGKSLLLFSEQGHGDMIQFARFAPRVKSLGGAVYVECPANLKLLFSGLSGIDGLVGCEDDSDFIDLQFPLLSVPRVLGVGIDEIPSGTSYLSLPDLDTSDVADDLSKFKAAFKVGIVWEGDRASPTHLSRSCALRYFSVLNEVRGVQLFSLQYGMRESAASLESLGIQSLSDLLGDFVKTARVASHMDLILTVDTSMAHLAGALGLPVWTILPEPSDWRWMSSVSHTPWYPTMRLFRQPTRGDWVGAMANVKSALGERVKQPDLLA